LILPGAITRTERFLDMLIASSTGS
jgi:hypothetical protein